MPVQLNGQDFLASFSDVETGVFTPQIADDNRDGSGECQAYTTQIGRYTKIGNRVLFSIYIATSSIGSLNTAQAAAIVGLPFTSINSTNARHAITSGFGRTMVQATAGASVAGYINANVSAIILESWDVAEGSTFLTLTEWSADGALTVAGVYEI